MRRYVMAVVGLFVMGLSGCFGGDPLLTTSGLLVTRNWFTRWNATGACPLAGFAGNTSSGVSTVTLTRMCCRLTAR